MPIAPEEVLETTRCNCEGKIYILGVFSNVNEKDEESKDEQDSAEDEQEEAQDS